MDEMRKVGHTDCPLQRYDGWGFSPRWRGSQN